MRFQKFIRSTLKMHCCIHCSRFGNGAFFPQRIIVKMSQKRPNAYFFFFFLIKTENSLLQYFFISKEIHKSISGFNSQKILNASRGGVFIWSDVIEYVLREKAITNLKLFDALLGEWHLNPLLHLYRDIWCVDRWGRITNLKILETWPS